MSKKDIEERHGISFGRELSERAVVERFKGKGVVMHPKTTYRLREDKTSGERLTRRLDMAEALKGNASKKDRFYHAIAVQGQQVRKVNGQGRYAGRGFMDAIADDLKINPQDARRSLRAMRAELVLSELNGETQFMDEFRLTTERYLNKFVVGWSASPALQKVDEEWTRDSIGEFYRNFYSYAETTSTLQTFPPYEADIMESYYRQRLMTGSELSVLDKLTLSKNANGSRLTTVVDVVRAAGVPYDNVVHFAHTNALLYGQPTRPVDQAS